LEVMGFVVSSAERSGATLGGWEIEYLS